MPKFLLNVTFPRCRACGSNMVVGMEGYERCLACHACFVIRDGQWVRTTDTPQMFRPEGVKPSRQRKRK